MQFRVQPTFRQADQAALNVFFPSLLFDQAGTTSAPGVALNAGTEDVAISVWTYPERGDNRVLDFGAGLRCRADRG